MGSWDLDRVMMICADEFDGCGDRWVAFCLGLLILILLLWLTAYLAVV